MLTWNTAMNFIDMGIFFFILSAGKSELYFNPTIFHNL